MDPILGSLILFAGNFAPNGWFYCDGALLPISQYQALFSLLGTTYGGDGITTFALPDLRGRAAVHTQTRGNPPAGTLAFQLGQAQGTSSSSPSSAAATVVGNLTLTTANLPAHTHAVTVAVAVSTNPSDDNQPTGNVMGPCSAEIYSSSPSPTAKMGGVTATAADTGSGTPAQITSTGAVAIPAIPTQAPSLGLNYIIAWQGVYPSRP